MAIERLLSANEYFHANFGTSPNDSRPFAVTLVFEGEGTEFSAQEWRTALSDACAANSGSHLRLLGNSVFARWKNDGEPARLRMLDHTNWDGESHVGAEFIDAVPLCITHGPTVELILINNSPRGKLLIIRALHAVMDGRGTLHFLADVFRSLRNEPLEGSNTTLGDAQLLKLVTRPLLAKEQSEKMATDRLTGPPQGNSRQDVWRRVHLDTTGKRLMPRIAQCIAEYLHSRSNLPAIISIPVDLRPRIAGLRTTTNFFGMLIVQLRRGEDASDFRGKLDALIEARMDIQYHRGQGFVKLLPGRIFHWAIWRLISFYTHRSPLFTAGISNLGQFHSHTFSCDSFRARSYIGIPYPGRTDIVLTGLDHHIEMTVRMPEIFANNGRLDHFITFVAQRIKELEAGQAENDK